MAACGGGAGEGAANEADGQEMDSQQTEAPATEEAPEEVAPQSVTLELKTTGETMATMAYEPSRLEVPAGAEVTVNLDNTASAAGMIHNVVFIERGAQEEISTAALDAGKDAGFIPESSKIIAHSALAQPGEKVSVTFTAPSAAGTYQFICTYPGHTAMKGILLVK